MTNVLRGYDFDDVTSIGINLVPPCAIVSGRTFSEYDSYIKQFTDHCPVYIRGCGAPGDQQHAGRHKAAIINLLGITEFYEDDPIQMRIIMASCPTCAVHLVRLSDQGEIIVEKQ